MEFHPWRDSVQSQLTFYKFQWCHSGHVLLLWHFIEGVFSIDRHFVVNCFVGWCCKYDATVQWFQSEWILFWMAVEVWKIDYKKRYILYIYKCQIVNWSKLCMIWAEFVWYRACNTVLLSRLSPHLIFLSAALWF